MPMDLAREPWLPGTSVVAEHNFRGNNPEDLPFRKGDVLTIIQPTKDPNWYSAKNNQDKEGMIPANYVKVRKQVTLHAMPWFHGKITRQEAERLLKPLRDGLFLIRESNNFPGDYTLCVCHCAKVEHYHILCRNNKLTIDEELYVNDLKELVEHYTRDADGLCTRLITPLQKLGNNFGTVNVQEFQKGGWTIRPEDLIVGEFIGKGEFGDVFKGQYRSQPVAIKQLKDKNRAAQTFLQEASVMTSLRHKNLVCLIGIVMGDTISLVTEFMGKGNLAEYLRSRGRLVITKKELLNFAIDTCSGMEYLEGKNIVHRDLATRNVLINNEGCAKVSDFGLAQYEDYSAQGGKFPIKWTAPEALRDNKFTTKSDMWSFGILLWEVYSFGRVPYPRIPLSDVVMHVERGYRMEAPEGCPPEIYNIMMKAWTIEPERRPSFNNVLEQLQNLISVTV